MTTVRLNEFPALCDVCAQSRVHEVAMKHVESGVMGAGGNWIGKLTSEKSDKWGVALRKAHDELCSPCLIILSDDGEVSVCRSCLAGWLGLFDSPGK